MPAKSGSHASRAGGPAGFAAGQTFRGWGRDFVAGGQWLAPVR